MYRYDEFDRQLVKARVIQFTDQLERYRSGALTDDEFRTLAPAKRALPPAPCLHAACRNPVRDLGGCADEGTGGYCRSLRSRLRAFHHAPEHSGSTGCNWTAYPPCSAIWPTSICTQSKRRVIASAISPAIPMQALPPMKSKTRGRVRNFSVSGRPCTPSSHFCRVSSKSRSPAAALIAPPFIFTIFGIRLVRNERDEVGYEIIVGGGQGRTPIIGQMLKPFVSRPDLLPYLESVLRVYNLHGRRDNKYKARIKILVKSLGLQAFAAEVEADFFGADHAAFALAAVEFERIERYFSPPCPYVGNRRASPPGANGGRVFALAGTQRSCA